MSSRIYKSTDVADCGFEIAQGLMRYPVDGSRLAATRVIATSYRPVAHFIRRLVIPDLQLSEWERIPHGTRSTEADYRR